MGLFKRKQKPPDRAYLALISKIGHLESHLKSHLDLQEQHVLSLEKESEKGRLAFEKQTMSLEDMLDTLQEKEEQDTLAIKRIKELEKAEESLLQLNYAYQQNLNLIERYLEAIGVMDDSWQNQFQLVKSTIKDYQTRCSIIELTGCGETVNYDYHQVIEAIDTDDPELNFMIAKVYEPGFVYLGKVKVKAQVAAYRLKHHAESTKE